MSTLVRSNPDFNMQLVCSLAKRIGVIALLIVMVSCKSTKTIAAGEVDATLSSKKIVQKHYQNQSDFNTLSGKLKIDVTDGENAQGVSVSFRMKKDEVIWISAPVGVVKAKVTPNKVSFYNRLQNEYFDGDFEYFSNLLGTEVDFKLLQNLLLGNAVLDLRKDRYVASIVQEKYRLQPKNARALYKILFLIEPKNFKIANQQLAQPKEKRLLTIDYTYQELSEKVIPNVVKVAAINKNFTNDIVLEYRNMEFGRELRFPYKIPKGFKKIELK